MLIIGNPTDQITSLIWGQLSSSFFKISSEVISSYPPYQQLFSEFIRPWTSNEPIYFLLMSVLGTIFHENAYNLYLLLVFFANFITYFVVFKKYKFWWFGCLTFNLSGYFFLHLGIHPNLINLWTLPLFYKLYEEKKYNLIPIYILGVTLLSNYIGFILIVMLCTLIFSKNLLILIKKNSSESNIKKELSMIFFTALLICVFLFRFIALNYFKTQNNVPNKYVLERSIVDFSIFSAKPWYLLIPAEKNPILSNIAYKENMYFQSFNNYMFHQYFYPEHAALFMGFSFYMLLIWALYKYKKDSYLILSSILIFILMMPPEVVINGYTLILPSYFIYKVFSVFRVTTRLVIAVHFLLTIFLIRFLEENKSQRKIGILVGLLTALIICETFIPIKFLRLESPKEYIFIRDNTEANAQIIVYPNSKTREALLWLPVHERILLNASGVNYGNYNVKEFNDSLFKTENNINGYLLVDNKFLSEIPTSYKLIQKFEASTLLYK